MASRLDLVEYICNQIQNIGVVTYKKMFGEYGVYVGGKLTALICDDQLFLKPTEAARAQLRTVVEAPPYQGAKPSYLIEEVDDGAYLSALMLATYEALPEPKPKKPKASKRKSAPAVKKGKSPLQSLPNIGPKIEAQLQSIGIETPEALQAEGSRAAWLKIKAIDPSACSMRLQALEGAVQGISVNSLSSKDKEALRAFYAQYKG